MMKALIIPALLTLVGTGGGIGAGIYLQPDAEETDLAADACNDGDTAQMDDAAALIPDIGAARDYARLNNQFVVPVVEDGRVSALVVMSLSIEVAAGTTETVFASEPKLRDGFLQNMFSHANIGGFSGNFTESSNMRILRNDLLQTAQQILGGNVTDVLITDIVRQDT